MGIRCAIVGQRHRLVVVPRIVCTVLYCRRVPSISQKKKLLSTTAPSTYLAGDDEHDDDAPMGSSLSRHRLAHRVRKARRRAPVGSCEGAYRRCARAFAKPLYFARGSTRVLLDGYGRRRTGLARTAAVLSGARGGEGWGGGGREHQHQRYRPQQ